MVKKYRLEDTAAGFEPYSVIYALSAWLLPHRLPQTLQRNEMPRQLITVVRAFLLSVMLSCNLRKMSHTVVNHDFPDLAEILLTARKIPDYIWKKQQYGGT